MINIPHHSMSLASRWKLNTCAKHMSDWSNTYVGMASLQNCAAVIILALSSSGAKRKYFLTSAQGLLRNVTLQFHLRGWITIPGFPSKKNGIRQLGFVPPPPSPSIGVGISQERRPFARRLCRSESQHQQVGPLFVRHTHMVTQNIGRWYWEAYICLHGDKFCWCVSIVFLFFFDFLFVLNLVLVLKMRPRGYLFWKLAPNSPPLHHKGLRSGNEDSPQLRVQQSSQSSLMGEQLVDLRLPSVKHSQLVLWTVRTA